MGDRVAATDEELGRLAASELAGVVERPRLISRVGLWLTFVAHVARSDERVLVHVRPRATVNDEVAERVLRAAAADRTREHPSVLPVQRFGSSERLLWISLPEMGGWPLRQWFSEERAPSASCALEFLRHVAGPLTAIHAAGQVHGALTPSCFHRDASGIVRVCCPGVDLQLLRGDLTSDVESEAAAFAAPEVRAGQEPGAAADQYGLAAILVKLISGRVATAGEDLPPEVPGRWASSLRRALDRDPRGRHPSVRALVARLDPDSLASAASWGAGGSPSARAGRVYEPSWLGRRGRQSRPAEALDEAPPLDEQQVLFPSADGEEEAKDEEEERPPEPAGGPSRGWARRITAAILLLLLGSTAGVVYAGAAPAGVPAVLSATIDGWVDDWLDNWYGWAPIGERLEGVAPPAPSAPTETAASPASSSTPSEAPPLPEAAGAGLEPGRLSLQSVPSGAVYIDDVFVGDTPLLDVRVRVGDRRIRIERPTYDPFSLIVTVEPGQTLRLTGIELTGDGRD